MEPARRGRPQEEGASQLDAAKPAIEKAFDKGMTLKEMMRETPETSKASREQWKRKLKKWGLLSNGAGTKTGRRVAMRDRKTANVLQNEEAHPSESASERDTNPNPREEFREMFLLLANNPDMFREQIISASGLTDNQAMDVFQQEIREMVVGVSGTKSLAEDVGSLDEKHLRGVVEDWLELLQYDDSDNDEEEDRAV